MGILLSESAQAGTTQSPFFMLIIWVAVFGLMLWMMTGPQKKEQKRLKAMLADMEIGDSVLTTSGFYGMVIDITEDTVIVEFGNNKNCRIPMKKSAIVQIEKPGAE